MSLTASVLKGDVKPGIKWHIEKAPVKSPYADCGSQEIHLQETYLGFVWAMTYSLLIIYEEGVQKRMISGCFSGMIKYDTQLLQRARQLFEWAVSLKDSYSDWDLSLPNPERHNNPTEKWYAEKVNGLFQDIVVYSLFHEYAHLTNEHCAALKNLFGKPLSELKAEEIALWKRIETEADIVAFESIIDKASDSEQYKLHKGVAIVLAHSMMLFILRNPKSVTQIVHPDVDNRIHYSISQLSLQDPSSQDYIWYLGSLCCKFFFDLHSIPTDLSTTNTTEDLFFRYLGVFDSIKAN